MKKLLIFICCMMLTGLTGQLLAANKSDLKVLYVGGNPDYETYSTKKTPEERASSVKSRMGAFDALLREYFKAVTVVEAQDYKPEMSKSYDVTVFDGRIPAIKPAIHEKDAEGNTTKYVRAQLLPEDFDCAAMTIASLGEDVGRAVGSKNDWYCLCLDAQAHHLVKDHPIFKGPFKTKLTFEKCPTPEDAYHYSYYYDGKIPDSILMWRVQTKGYKTDKGFPVGMVSRPWGYTDSPDAEYISSGVCAKTLDAVAIGRHGNFLTWGFAASPTYMTDEAKDVFANAICYIAKFKGKGMLARKYNDRIATREYLKELSYLATMEPYLERAKWVEEANQKIADAKAKQAKGEVLSEDEQYYAKSEPDAPLTLDAYLKRYQKEAYELLGAELEAYPKYYTENKYYFYGGQGSYVLVVDEDCKAWGIPNNDKRLLDEAISCLERGVEVDRAQRLLDRYTLCTFTTPAEWRKWFDTYNQKMFFTESGGWVFLIDGPATLPGNDYHARDKKVEATPKPAANQPGATSQEQPVSVAANLIKEGNGSKIEVKFRIHQGFHIYKAVAASDAYLPVVVELSLPDGSTAGAQVSSVAQPFGSAGTTIFENEATYTVPVAGTGKGAVKCTVQWQCCDAHVCLMPETREFSFEL